MKNYNLRWEMGAVLLYYRQLVNVPLNPIGPSSVYRFLSTVSVQAIFHSQSQTGILPTITLRANILHSAHILKKTYRCSQLQIDNGMKIFFLFEVSIFIHVL